VEKEEKVIQVLRGEPSQSISHFQSRLMAPFYLGLRDVLLARIKSGVVTEDMDLSSNLGSLNIAQLATDIRRSCEELGIDPTVPVTSVGDLLRILETIDFKREYEDKSPPQTP
jgi:hypothetical protein